jgi:hypothetical protein
MRGAWLDSLSSKDSNKNSKTISKTVQTRSDPSGGGGFNRSARSPQGLGPSATSTHRKAKIHKSKSDQKRLGAKVPARTQAGTLMRPIHDNLE